MATPKEREPAPAATETSSKENNFHTYNNTDMMKSQVSHAIEMLSMTYQCMTDEERHAWDLGEVYARLCVMEEIMKTRRA